MEVHVCISYDGYLCNTRGITTLLGESFKSLEEMGYHRNEYNWCVMNNIIDNKQCTILWHFDDLKTSYVDPAVVSSVLAEIYVEYGKISKMTITRGKVHKYLWVTID